MSCGEHLLEYLSYHANCNYVEYSVNLFLVLWLSESQFDVDSLSFSLVNKFVSLLRCFVSLWRLIYTHSLVPRLLWGQEPWNEANRHTEASVFSSPVATDHWWCCFSR